jgi:hypothetical protein
VTEATERVRLLYVGGMHRSGSTLADMMIGQLPGHVGVGELFYLWADGPKHDVTCACGESFSQCPFWRAVGGRAFGGWPASLADEMLQLQREVDRTALIPKLLTAREDSQFAATCRRYTGRLADLYRAIAEVAGADVVVDSSKRPSLPYALRREPGIDLAVAQVVRDPRGVAYSWSKVVPDSATYKGDMPRWSAATVSRRWVTVNAAVRWLRRAGVPSVVVRYEDLVSNPAAELARISALHGTAATPEELPFLADGGVRPNATHTIAGSRIRHSKGVLRLRLDEEWRTQLPARDRRLVSLATGVSRWRYDYHG